MSACLSRQRQRDEEITEENMLQQGTEENILQQADGGMTEENVSGKA